MGQDDCEMVKIKLLQSIDMGIRQLVDAQLKRNSLTERTVEDAAKLTGDLAAIAAAMRQSIEDEADA